jgi:hypothetical protein
MKHANERQFINPLDMKHDVAKEKRKFKQKRTISSQMLLRFFELSLPENNFGKIRETRAGERCCS